ncbi:MAG: M36 family metallopeptidase [Candidatus Thermoplasmatota archaeon]|nr:M36 family metallopeptidase [Candidatus Thermoplasmatota archaeon]
MKSAICLLVAIMMVSAIPMADGFMEKSGGSGTADSVVDWNTLTVQGLLTQPSSAAPIDIATKYLNDNWQTFADSKADIESLRYTMSTKSITANHVFFQQTYRGYEVIGGTVSVHIRNDGVVQIVHSNIRNVYAELNAPILTEPLAIASAKIAIGFVQPLLTQIPYSGEAAFLKVLPIDGGRLVWEATVPALNPLGVWAVYIDASTSEIIEKKDTAKYMEIPGKVFLANPVVLSKDRNFKDNPAQLNTGFENMYSDVVLRDLDETLVAAGILSGKYVNIVDKCEAGVGGVLNFDYTRDQPQFENVMAYYGVEESQMYAQSLGFKDLFQRPMTIVVKGLPGIANGMSATIPGVPEPYNQMLLIGWHAVCTTQPAGGVEDPVLGLVQVGGFQTDGFLDATEDPEVVIHEYGHALLSSVGFSSGGDEAAAIHEGFGDWWSGICQNPGSNGTWDNFVGEWFTSYLYPPKNDTVPPALRNMDNNYTYDNYSSDLNCHWTGQIWSGPLWDIWQEMGRDNASRLIVEAIHFFGSCSSFDECASAVLQADVNLNNGTNGYFLVKTFENRNFTLTIPPGLNTTAPGAAEKQQSVETVKKTPGFEAVAILGAIALVSAAFAARRKK